MTEFKKLIEKDETLTESLRWLATKEKIGESIQHSDFDAFLLELESHLPEKYYDEVIENLERIVTDKVIEIKEIKSFIETFSERKVPEYRLIDVSPSYSGDTRTFMNFRFIVGSKLHEENPNMGLKEFDKILNKKWDSLSKSERDHYSNLISIEGEIEKYIDKKYPETTYKNKLMGELYNSLVKIDKDHYEGKKDVADAYEVEIEMIFEDHNIYDEDAASKFIKAIWVDKFRKNLRQISGISRKKSSRGSKSKNIGNKRDQSLELKLAKIEQWKEIMTVCNDYINSLGIDSFVNLLEDFLKKNTFRDVLEKMERIIVDIVFSMDKIDRDRLFKVIIIGEEE